MTDGSGKDCRYHWPNQLGWSADGESVNFVFGHDLYALPAT